MSRTLALALLLIAGAAHAAPYDRHKTQEYAALWYMTDLIGPGRSGPDGLVDHVNWPQYGWYYLKENPAVPGAWDSAVNRGDNTIALVDGMDCTNFMSQLLKAGGLQMDGHLGRGGTFLRVRELGAALKAVATTKVLRPGDAADFLEVGDVIKWDNTHLTMVYEKDGAVRLAAHTEDRLDGSVDHYFAQGHLVATAYHIRDAGGRVPTLAATNPSLRLEQQGMTVPNRNALEAGPVLITVSHPVGVGGLEITRGAPLVDDAGERQLRAGKASFVYSDPQEYGTSQTYRVDLAALHLKPGEAIFVQAYGVDGGLTIQEFRLEGGYYH